jgi:hypothetical protein
MNNYLKLRLLLFCVVFIYSCSNSSKQFETINRKGEKLYTMQMLPYKTFNMDDNTSQITNYFQTVTTIDDTLRFTMYSSNIIRKNILIFNISTGKVIDSVRLHKEGPHAIGNNVQGYYIHNKDSIYLYDYWQYTLILVNRRGEIINKINLSDKFLLQDSSKFAPSYPFPFTDMPIRRINNTFILQGKSGKVNDTKKIPTVTALYKLSDNTIKFVNSYPDVYGDTKYLNEHWGVSSYLMVPYDLNNKGEMILSYPADDHISVYDIVSNTTRRYFAGYSKKDIIRQLKGGSANVIVQYMENTSYGNIHFDIHRNLYYRFVHQPSYDYDINNRDTHIQNLSIVILDSEFNKVGEYDLKEKTIMSRCAFVSEEGLHIQTLSDNDDFMKFITLKPIKS